MMEPVPTVKEELERKTVELLEMMAHRVQNYRMDRRDLRLAGKLLWGVTSGLVDRSVSDLCEAAAAEGADRRLESHFVGKGRVVTVRWMPNSHGYEVLTIDATSLQTTRRSMDTEIGLREDELRTLFAGLNKSGYVEIN